MRSKESWKLSPGAQVKIIAEINGFATAKDLALAADLPEDFVVRLYNDDEPMTEELAEQLTVALGRDDEFKKWLLRIEDIYLKHIRKYHDEI